LSHRRYINNLHQQKVAVTATIAGKMGKSSAKLAADCRSKDRTSYTSQMHALVTNQ